jgi:hypothetical protein
VDPSIITFFQNAGPVGAISLLFWLIWQKSEERSAKAAEKSEERYAELSKDFKQIVERNTEASTRLCMLIETQVLNGNGKRG